MLHYSFDRYLHFQTAGEAGFCWFAAEGAGKTGFCWFATEGGFQLVRVQG